MMDHHYQKILSFLERDSILSIWTKRLFPLILFLLFALFILRDVISVPGSIGLYHDWFLGPFPQQATDYSSSALNYFSSETGNKGYPTDWLFRLALYPISSLGGELITKGLLVTLLTLTGLGMFYLGRTMGLRVFWSVIVGLIYLFSPIMFTRIISGYLYYLLAFALAPFMLALFLKAIDERPKRWGRAGLSGILLGAMATQIQFLIMGPFVLLVLVIFDYKRIRTALPVLFMTIIVAALIQLPWVLPLGLGEATISVGGVTSPMSYHEIVSAPSLWESMRMLGYGIHPYSYTQLNAQGIIPDVILILDISLLAVAMGAVLLRPKPRVIGLALIVLVGIFLAKGANEPGGEVFTFLFLHTPLFMFREIWHIVFLAMLPCSILAGFFLQDMVDRFGQIASSNLKKRGVQTIALSLAVVVVISNGYPLLLGSFAGYVQHYEMNGQYAELVDGFSSDADDYRILWEPSFGPMRYQDLERDGWSPMILNSPKPTYPQISQPGVYFSDLNMFFTSQIQNNGTSNLGAELAPFATRYVVLTNDFKSSYPNFVWVWKYPDRMKLWSNEVTGSFLDNQNDLRKVSMGENISVYENQNPADMIYASSRVIFASADLGILTSLASFTETRNTSFLTSIDLLPSANPIIVTRDDSNDALAVLGAKVTSAGDYAWATSPFDGWMAAKKWFWYDTSFAANLGQGAFTMANSTIDIPLDVAKDGSIWVSVLLWDEGGQIEFAIGNHTRTINTHSSSHHVSWIKLFNMTEGASKLNAKSIVGSNYIEGVMTIDPQELEQLKTSAGKSNILNLLTAGSFTLADEAKRPQTRNLELPKQSSALSEIVIFSNGTYTLTLDLQGKVELEIGGHRHMVESNSRNKVTFSLELEAGIQNLSIYALSSSIMGDIWIASGQRSVYDVLAPLPSPELTYSELSTNSWMVKGNVSQPFMLALALPYDGAWSATVNGEKIEPLPLYDSILGFWINATGPINIQVTYLPQTTYNLGLFLAIGTLVVVCSAILMAPIWNRYGLLKRIMALWPR